MKPLVLVVLTLWLGARGLAGQGTDRWAYSATRAMLEDWLRRLELAQSSGQRVQYYPDAPRAAATVRRRLLEGDFQVGERIYLKVEGEAALSDTFRVDAARRLTLPSIGEVTLVGVLRSELEAHLRSELGRFLREPVVYARSLIPVSILGAVNRPGFYTLPVEFPLTDALMAAGGPAEGARLNDVRIERGTERFALREALEAGRTIGDLGIQPGDRLVVPRQRSFLNESGVRTMTLLLSIPAAIYGLTRVFD